MDHLSSFGIQARVGFKQGMNKRGTRPIRKVKKKKIG
jgi:hypothetical protein